jgi:hypothetical protein
VVCFAVGAAAGLNIHRSVSFSYSRFDNRIPLTHSNLLAESIPPAEGKHIICRNLFGCKLNRMYKLQMYCSFSELHEGGLEEETSRRNNNLQSSEEGQEEDEMGDLQSPTYVKRTAHMFNSKYSSQVCQILSHIHFYIQPCLHSSRELYC